VVRQGEPTTTLYLVARGLVRLSAVARSGREVVVGLLGRGEVFGEGVLLGLERSPVEARAVGTAEVVAIDIGTVDDLVRREPHTAAELLRLVAARLHRTSEALEDALTGNVPARVTRRLWELASTHGVPDPGGVRLPLRLTQEDLGRMVGAARETVNRTLSTLTANGLVRTDDRRYVIPDLDALRRIALEEATA
jgi:CRP-like cAMP-binding protein